MQHEQSTNWVIFTEITSMDLFNGAVRVEKLTRITPKCVFTRGWYGGEERHMKADIVYRVFDSEDAAREVQGLFLSKTAQAAENEILCTSALTQARIVHANAREKAIAEVFEEQLNDRG